MTATDSINSARLMLQLALDILPWLVAAAGLGFGIAWLLRGVGIAELQNQVQRLEADLILREHELGDARRAIERSPAPSHPPSAAPAASPDGFAAPPAGDEPLEKDDLKRIHGIGPVLEQRLHQLGVFRFQQVAQWTDIDIDFFDLRLQTIRGRIRRENWVRSAAEQHLRQYGESLAIAQRTPAAGTAAQD
jgi:predicted flap endonuclease-1-like 5' DNA nuclease